MSYIVVVPSKRWRAVQVFTTDPADFWELYTLIQDNTTTDTRVTVAHCGEEQLGAWLENNVEPVWYESLLGRMRFVLHVMVAPPAA